MTADGTHDLPPAVVPPQLARLAELHGVATGYTDARGAWVQVRRDAVVAALGAMGVPAGDESAVEAALREQGAAPWRRALPPVLVARVGALAQARLPVRLPEHAGPELVVVLEDGGRVPLDLASAPVTQRRDGLVLRELALPALPTGWHEVVGGGVSCVLLVAPDSLPPADGRTWGWQVQLYALRSAHSWGMGDYADLRTLVDSAVEDGAGAVLVNPLHAETPVLPVDPSPYSPSSRRLRSALYLRLEDLPEYRDAAPELQEQVRALRPASDPERIVRDDVWRAKRAALELLWPAADRDAVERFRVERGAALEDTVLFFALADEHGLPWQQWPPEVRRPDGAGIAGARARHAERLAFWCWVQLRVDEQLAAAAAGFTGDGTAVGIVHDLAVGVSEGGADAWALQDALALGTSVGAPPDLFNQRGQDWGLPPWRPDRLVESAYAPYRSLVQSVLRHAGGLRIDHVMGLFRLWWVPPGATADAGTYVSYDAEALLGVLLLEAERAGAVVVGEDLGTVEDRVGTALTAAGVLGSAVLWFEREGGDGAFLAPQDWRRQALGSISTHDLPTAAGLLAGEQVRVRHELDQLGVPLEQEQQRAEQERAALLEMLEQQGLLAACDGDPVLAMHAALAATPCRIVLASPADAVGDVRQPNLPGTVDEYPNWRLPVADADGRPLPLEELLAAPRVRAVARLLDEGVRRGSGDGR